MVLHMEVCEDLWVPVAPSAQAALAGANVLVNLSGSPITVGRADDRELLARSASLRCTPPTCTPPPVRANPPRTCRGMGKP